MSIAKISNCQGLSVADYLGGLADGGASRWGYASAVGWGLRYRNGWETAPLRWHSIPTATGYPTTPEDRL